MGAWAQSLALSFRFLFIIVYILGAGWALSNFRIVPADNRALVIRAGAVAREAGPGLLMALPRPLEQVVMLPSAERQVEYKMDALVGEPTVNRSPRANVGLFLTGDMSVVHLFATVFYKITDAREYVLARDHVEPALERVFMASAMRVCSGRDLDTILVARPELETSGTTARMSREHFRQDLLDEMNRRFADLKERNVGFGVTITRVDLIPGIPEEAKTAFDSVLVALQRAETLSAEARTQAETTRQSAQQARDRLLTEAEAAADEQLANARTRTAAINALADSAQGLSGPMLANRIYRERIGALLNRAAEVVTTDSTGGGRIILPGAQPK